MAGMNPDESIHVLWA
jgi:hypothetical protein